MIERCKTEACIGIQATLTFSIPLGNASFIVNPTLASCGINYSCSVFSKDRKTHQHPCVSTWRLLLSCPMTCILLVLKTHNSLRPSSWTLFTNHWIISTAAFLLYLSVIFKLDVKVHYECKLGALSFGWTCFASEATACKDSCFGLPYSTTPSRRFCPQCATIYLVRIFKFFKFSCHFVSQGWVWRYLIFSCATRKTTGSVNWPSLQDRCCSSFSYLVWVRHCARPRNKRHGPSEPVFISHQGDKCPIT